MHWILNSCNIMWNECILCATTTAFSSPKIYYLIFLRSLNNSGFTLFASWRALFSFFTTNECCSRCCSLMLMFHFATNTEVHVVCILTAIRIYTAWFMFSFVAMNAFLYMHQIWSSANCFSREKPYKDTFDRHTQLEAERKRSVRMW